MKPGFLTRGLLPVVFWMAFTLSALAQQAQINGRVTDPSGAVVANTAITVTNADTGIVHKTESNQLGYFTVPLLGPGRYRVSAQHDGFRPLVRDGVVLQVGDNISLDLELQVGAASQSVTVTGEIPALRTEDVQTGIVIDNRRIQELPQYNRDPLAFVLLAPNVMGTSESAGDLRINGGRAKQIEYFVDGIPMTTGYGHNVAGGLPSREAIAEFKVITNGLAAEYGRLSGGAVIFATRSGTNQFHGSAYEFFRNDLLNANDWNSNRFGRKKGVFHDNVFGATLGGPVLVPKLYNGRDRTFFFLNYEGTRRRTGSNAQTTGVPTDLERQGDFSQSLIDKGVPVQIFDPLTSKLEGVRVVRSPFPGNRIPDSRIDPLSRIYLGYYPKPNIAPRPGSSHEQNYIGSTSTPEDNNRWSGRLDENWNSAHVTHFSISRFDRQRAQNRWLSPLQPASTQTGTATTISADHVWMLSPASLLNVRLGFVRNVSFSGAETAVDASSWQMAPEVVNLLGGTNVGRTPQLYVTGDTLSGLGGGSISDVRDTSYTALVSYQHTFGRHNFKAGMEHRRYYSNYFSGGTFSAGSDRRATTKYFDKSDTGSPFASWLLGLPFVGEGTQLAGPASLQPYWGAYAQDDIKVTPRLTVNLGLRWDFEPPRTERFDRQVFWDEEYRWNWQPAPGWSWEKVQQEAGITFDQPYWLKNGIWGRAGILGTKEYPMRTRQKQYPAHFGPRVGAAWEFLPRTVMRVGYGLLYLTMTGDTYLNSATGNIGYGDAARTLQDGTPDGGLTYPVSFSNPFPGGLGYVPYSRDVEALNRATMGNWFISPSYTMYPGYEHILEFSLQHDLGKGWAVEAAYNGNLARDLPVYNNGRHTVPKSYEVLGKPLGMKLFTQVSNPFYGQINPATTMGGKTIYLGRAFQLTPLWREVWTINDPLGWSNYHSAYFQVERRFSNGVAFLAHYTLSKMLTTGGGIAGQNYTNGANGFPQGEMGWKEVYSLTSFDVTHRVLLNYVADLPFGHGKRFFSSPSSLAAKAVEKVISGWTVAGTTTFRGGMPVYVACGGSECRNYITVGQGRHIRASFAYPNVVMPHVSGHQALEGSGNFQPYYPREAFFITQDMNLGTVPPVISTPRGPGFRQWDFALSKRIAIGSESRSLQLRFEGQNIFNHMNAGQPNGYLTERTFGYITSQSGSPRQIMLAAKFQF